MAHPYTDGVFLDRLIAKADPSAQATKIYKMLLEHYPAAVLGWVKQATWTLKTVSLSEINMARRPGGRNMDKVNAIADKVRAGVTMDPVVLIQQGKELDVADGFHRTLGFKKAGRTSIQAWVATDVSDGEYRHVEMHGEKKNVAPGEKADDLEELEQLDETEEKLEQEEEEEDE